MSVSDPAGVDAGARRAPRRLGRIGGLALLAVVVALMAWDTKVVRIGSALDARQAAFSPETYGAETYPKIRDAIVAKAVDAVTLAKAIAADKDAAIAQYGTPGGVGPVFAVSFTGTVGERKSSLFAVAVDGLADGPLIRIQSGPAINGTELRDATGTVSFGQFTNQIEYQDAGSALNNEMKIEVLHDLDRDTLTGKTVSVVGVFRLINPKAWLVTPVVLDVK